MFSSADPSLAAGKRARINLSQVSSKVASCKQFQYQNRGLRAFEAGYWKDFQNN
jgi:hypothetical protein